MSISRARVDTQQYAQLKGKQQWEMRKFKTKYLIAAEFLPKNKENEALISKFPSGLLAKPEKPFIDDELMKS